MKIVHLVNEPVATSIPLELAIFMSKSKSDSKVVAFYKDGNSNDVKLDDEKIDIFGFSKRSPVVSFFKFYKYLRSIQPDVVHVHHFASTFSVILCKFLGLNFKIIKTEHNSRRYSKFHQKLMGAFVFLIVDSIVCNSKATYDSFSRVEKKISENKVSVIYNGVDVETIRCNIESASSNCSDGKVKFFLACRFVPQKNLFRLIRAFHMVCENYENVELTIAGDGVQYSEVEALIQELNLEKRIHLVGMISRGEVYNYLVGADFYIVPSLWEGFCNSAVESMFAKVPLLVSDIDTLNEVVGSGCIKFDPLSEIDIKKSIVEALNMDSVEIGNISEKAYDFAVSRYGMNLSADAYFDLYRKVIS